MTRSVRGSGGTLSHAASIVRIALAGVLACGGGDDDDDGSDGSGTGDPSADAGAGSDDGGAQPGDGGALDGSVDDPDDPFPDDPQPGQFAWARLIPGARDQIAMAIAPDGSLAVAAGHIGPIALGPVELDEPQGGAVVVLKLAADATPIWGRSLGGADSIYVQDVAVTADGGVLVSGVYRGSGFDPGMGPLPGAGADEGFLVRLDGSSGATEWAKAFASTSDDTVAAIEAAPDGSFYAYGGAGQDIVVDGDAFPEGGFLARYDGGGARRWARSLAARPTWQGPMALDPRLGPVIAGRFNSSLELGDQVLTVDPSDTSEVWGSDIFLAGFDPDGGVRFARQIFDEGRPRLVALAVAPGGDLYLASSDADEQLVADGHTVWDTNGSGDSFLIRFTAEGLYRWSTSVDGRFEARGVTVDDQGAVYRIDECDTPFGSEPAIPCADAYGNVIVSYGPDDEYRWYASVAPGRVEAILPAPDGRIYIAGDANRGASIDFGGVRVEGNGIFVAALVPGAIVDPTPPPAPVIDTVGLVGIPDRQIRHGGTATMVVGGANLDEVTSARLGDVELRVLDRSANELRLAVEIPHGHAPGPLGLSVRNAGGSASFDGAVQVTPVVVATTGSDAGRGTDSSPFRLCRGDWYSLLERTDILRLRSGTYVCPDLMLLPRGVVVQGAGIASTTVRFGQSFTGFGTLDGFHGTTEFRGVALEGAVNDIIGVSSGHLAVTNVEVRGRSRIAFDSLGTATLAGYRYVGDGLGLLVQRGTVVATGVELNTSFRGALVLDGSLTITDSTIRTQSECGAQAGLESGSSTWRPQLTIANSMIASGRCGVRAVGADLRISDSQITADEGLAAVWASSGTVAITGSTVIAGQSSTGIRLDDWFDIDSRAPTTTLDDVDIEAGTAILYSTVASSPGLTMRRTRVRSVIDALTVFGPFGALDLGTPASPGDNELTSELGFPLVDLRDDAGAPIDARGTRLNGQTFTGEVTGPVELPGAYRLAGPNILRF